MTREELKAAGHEPMSPLQAIRAHCLDCCGSQANEVSLCPAVKCPSWPFRLGTNPWRKRASDARREAARRSMVQINARRRKGDGVEPAASPSEHGTAPTLAVGSGVALMWATARVDRDAETEQHRKNLSVSRRDDDQFQDGPAADGEHTVTTLGETAEGSAG